MPSSIDSRRDIASNYSLHTTDAALLAEALGCIVCGRQLPAPLRAPAYAAAAVTTTEEGIRRIIGAR